MDLKDIRSEYINNSFSKKDIPENPVTLIKKWIDQAVDSNLTHPTSASVATVDSNGNISNRIILIKEVKEKSVIFFTNYNSKKGQALIENPKISVNLFWKEFDRQINISGVAQKLDHNSSVEYFNSRPLGSRISAIISDQSSEVELSELENDFKELELKAKQNPEIIKCPNNWGGFEVKIDRIEFWVGKPSRLHDRIECTKAHENWIIKRLAP